MRVSHSRPSINETDLEVIVSNLRSKYIASGEETNLFVNDLSNYIGVRGGVAVNSGTNALHLALMGLDAKTGDEVILPSYVCSSVLNAVDYTGATPIFVDIEPDGYNIDYNSIEEKKSENTKCVIVPHLFGIPADLNKITKLEIPVIEDCAQSVGAEYNGKKVGSFTDLSIYSFYATKVLTTGQGGMVLTDSEEIIEKLNDLTKYNQRENYNTAHNYSLTDFQAAMGRSQLKKLDSFVDKRKNIAGVYTEVFEEVGQVIPNTENSIFFRYVIEVDNPDKYIEEMGKLGVDCAKPVFKPLHQYFDLESDEFLNTEKAHNRAISIPIYPSMKNGEIQQVCGAIRKVWDSIK